MKDKHITSVNKTLGRRSPTGIIGKRKKRSNCPEKRRAEIQSKKVFGVPLTLDEKRAEEAQAVKPILKEH